MTDNPELEFRRFTSKDIESLKITFELCFKTKPSTEYFRWKYFDNPVGEVIAFVAMCGETVAAFYGVIPELYVVNGKVKRIYQSMDTMTHPHFQRRGLFVKLANMTYDSVSDIEGELRVVGIGGPTSYGGLVGKLKWQDVYKFKYLFTGKVLFKTANLLTQNKSLEITAVTEMNDDLAEFLNDRELSVAPIQPHISPSFFNWRVLNSADRDFQTLQIRGKNKTVGVCVYTIDAEKRCLIHFLNFLSDDLFAVYTSSVIKYLFKKTKSSFVFTWKPLNRKFRKELQKEGFIFNPINKGLFSYQIPFVVRVDGKTTDENIVWTDYRSYDIQPLMQD